MVMKSHGEFDEDDKLLIRGEKYTVESIDPSMEGEPRAYYLSDGSGDEIRLQPHPTDEGYMVIRVFKARSVDTAGGINEETEP